MLRAGDHVMCSHDVYGGTARLFNQFDRGTTASRSSMWIRAMLKAVEAAIKPIDQAGARGDAQQSADVSDRHCGD